MKARERERRVRQRSEGCVQMSEGNARAKRCYALQILALRDERNRRARVEDGISKLAEYHRFVREWHALLKAVILVVHTNAEDFARVCNRREQAHLPEAVAMGAGCHCCLRGRAQSVATLKEGLHVARRAQAERRVEIDDLVLLLQENAHLRPRKDSALSQCKASEARHDEFDSLEAAALSTARKESSLDSCSAVDTPTLAKIQLDNSRSTSRY